MNIIARHATLIGMLMLLVLTPFDTSSAVAAAKPIAKVILAVGDVTATNANGEVRTLKRRAKVFEGDTLNTSKDARCQIRLTDGSLISLPESSDFRIESYHYNGTSDGSEKAVYSLLKGGMRTLSGAIGKKNEDNYQLKTSVATIGIRGTAYDLYLHEKGSGESELYGNVDSGSIVISNKGGTMQLAGGENFHVPGQGLPPQTILVLPDFYPTEESADGSEQGGETTEGDVSEETLTDDDAENAETLVSEQPTESTDTTLLLDSGENLVTSTTTTDVSLTGGGLPAPTGAYMGIAFTKNDSAYGITAASGFFPNILPNELYIDEINGIGNVPVSGRVYFPPDPTMGDTGCDPCTFASATATLTDTGGDPIGVNWGRWSGDYVIVENGLVQETTASMHYIYSPNITPLSVVQSMTGSISYTLAGGTSPTDYLGNVGTLNFFNIGVDFSAQAVTSAWLGLTIAGTDINASLAGGSVPITTAIAVSGGINIQDTTNNLDGDISMQFIGSKADAIAATYSLWDSATMVSTQAVTGTAFLKPGITPP